VSQEKKTIRNTMQPKLLRSSQRKQARKGAIQKELSYPEENYHLKINTCGKADGTHCSCSKVLGADFESLKYRNDTIMPVQFPVYLKASLY